MNKNSIIFHLLVTKLFPTLSSDLDEKDIIIAVLKNSCLFHNNKFKVYKDLVASNVFITKKVKERFLDYFCLIQKHICAFHKFYRIILWKNIKELPQKYDLFFNELDSFSEDKKITLIEDNKKFTFKISDILHIICTSISHSDNMFVDPIPPKNPYTGIVLSFSSLYNIAIRCIENNIPFPKLFFYYFSSGFYLSTLRIFYEPYLHECAIKSFYQSMSNYDKYEQIKHTIHLYYNVIPLEIHDRYPQYLLLDKLEHTVLISLCYEYSLFPTIKVTNHNKLHCIFSKFYNDNPTFGRMYYNSRNNSYSHINNVVNFGITQSTRDMNNDNTSIPNIFSNNSSFTSTNSLRQHTLTFVNNFYNNNNNIDTENIIHDNEINNNIDTENIIHDNEINNNSDTENIIHDNEINNNSDTENIIDDNEINNTQTTTNNNSDTENIIDDNEINNNNNSDTENIIDDNENSIYDFNNSTANSTYLNEDFLDNINDFLDNINITQEQINQLTIRELLSGEDNDDW